MFFQLPPAGDPIVLDRASAVIQRPEDLFDSWVPRFYDSGTAALAASLCAAVKRHTISDPEVILPAYACPDLVSAAQFAGVRPVLVDFEPDRPWMDLDQVAARINSSTVAVIAVNLFGIPERFTALRALIGSRPVLLIEDSAQSFPVQVDAGTWQGDLVVLSFGRGKPVTLLGGGAVLHRDAVLNGLLPQAPATTADRLFRVKRMLYNMVSHPGLYWVPAAIPFLHLGETRYHLLPDIEPMDSTRYRQLAINIVAYRERGQPARTWVKEMFARIPVKPGYLADLAIECELEPAARLLRYPLLVAEEKRDLVLRSLNKQGLGASGMYPSALPSIRGLESMLQGQGTFPHADRFARRIVTLPIHSRVRRKDVAEMGRILRECLQ